RRGKGPEANYSLCFEKRGDYPHCLRCSSLGSSFLLCSICRSSANFEPRLCRPDTSRRHSRLKTPYCLICVLTRVALVAPTVLIKDPWFFPLILIFLFFFFLIFYFFLIFFFLVEVFEARAKSPGQDLFPNYAGHFMG